MENEQAKLKRFEVQFHDFESKQKMIDDLMTQISALEKEKLDLLKEHGKFSSMNEEVSAYKQRLTEMNEMIEARDRELEKEREDRASIEHSQEELLQKMKELQKENDELVIKLEGLKSENDTLITKNKRLEDRIKVLEGQNKQQLQQVNDTLKMPVPVTRDSEVVATCAAPEIEQILEIGEQIRKASLEQSERSSLHLSSSPPNLTVPSVILDDDKRPATPEKDLKIIPKIIEPTSEDAEKIREQYASSQDAPTISRDSSRKHLIENSSQPGEHFSFSFSSPLF